MGFIFWFESKTHCIMEISGVDASILMNFVLDFLDSYISEFDLSFSGSL